MYTNYISKGELVLCHHGIKGQKWGVRRYQNEDGTLTAEGKERYKQLCIMYNHDGNYNRKMGVHKEMVLAVPERATTARLKNPAVIKYNKEYGNTEEEYNKHLNDELYKDKRLYKKYFLKAYHLNPLFYKMLPSKYRKEFKNEINRFGGHEDLQVQEAFMKEKHPELFKKIMDHSSFNYEWQEKYRHAEEFKVLEKHYGKKLKDI